MKKFIYVLLSILAFNKFYSQSFIRSELTTTLSTPWEITYGPEGNLWITEKNGVVSRVNPITGAKKIVYTAPDYSAGFPSEQCTSCHQPNIGTGTHGLALHPDFMNVATPYIYFVYSYNSGTAANPATRFKIVRLTWNASGDSVSAATDLVVLLPSGFDHLGGRLMAVSQNSTNYLYFTVGDNGVSETNSPTCYNPQSLNPNNYCQDTSVNNGKIHRFNINGSIPSDNPVPGRSVFTRGHRNPQGLMFNPLLEIMYSIEHGDRTDDEINVLQSGKNYGWKYIRGYHADNNYPGEAASISSFTANPGITGDGLKEPLYSWCATPQPTAGSNGDWCTVAPSDGIYYNKAGSGIPGWDNSLLVVTLKNGLNTDQEMYRFQLNPDGVTMAPSTSVSPNPEKFFAGDQALNGRLRDIAVSPTGDKIFLINNGGTDRDKITVYTYNPVGIKENTKNDFSFLLFPNPASGVLNVKCERVVDSYEIADLLGSVVLRQNGNAESLDVSSLKQGYYFVRANIAGQKTVVKSFVKE
ncbi:MAG: Quinoprotein glucose dehydrogenase [Bacteroidetes bacterium]|nr:Quinoprotein glucose dehydrogenase [Bacteroidota bacterium]